MLSIVNPPLSLSVQVSLVFGAREAVLHDFLPKGFRKLTSGK
jgi:hypothetical protein